jgi:hypothetical protein
MLGKERRLEVLELRSVQKLEMSAQRRTCFLATVSVSEVEKER